MENMIEALVNFAVTVFAFMPRSRRTLLFASQVMFTMLFIALLSAFFGTKFLWTLNDFLLYMSLALLSFLLLKGLWDSLYAKIMHGFKEDLKTKSNLPDLVGEISSIRRCKLSNYVSLKKVVRFILPYLATHYALLTTTSLAIDAFVMTLYPGFSFIESIKSYPLTALVLVLVGLCAIRLSLAKDLSEETREKIADWHDWMSDIIYGFSLADVLKSASTIKRDVLMTFVRIIAPIPFFSDTKKPLLHYHHFGVLGNYLLRRKFHRENTPLQPGR